MSTPAGQPVLEVTSGSETVGDEIAIATSLVRQFALREGDYLLGRAVELHNGAYELQGIDEINDLSATEFLVRIGQPRPRMCLSFRIVADISAADLAGLCSALSAIYDALLVVRIAGGELAADDEDDATTHRDAESDLKAVRANLDALAPNPRLRVRSVCLGSPGDVNLEGSGEIVDAASNFFDRVYTRRESRRAAQLANEAAQAELEQERQRHEREMAARDLDLGMARWNAAKQMFMDLHGSDVLTTEAGRAEFARFLQGIGVLDSLEQGGKIALPPRLKH